MKRATRQWLAATQFPSSYMIGSSLFPGDGLRSVLSLLIRRASMIHLMISHQHGQIIARLYSHQASPLQHHKIRYRHSRTKSPVPKRRNIAAGENLPTLKRWPKTLPPTTNKGTMRRASDPAGVVFRGPAWPPISTRPGLVKKESTSTLMHH